MLSDGRRCIETARAFRQAGEHDKAKFWALRAAGYCPPDSDDYWEALDELSLAYYHTGFPGEAREMMSSLVPLVPAEQYARICENISWAQKVCDGRVKL